MSDDNSSGNSENPKAPHLAAHRFPKGKSGNPSGRPKGYAGISRMIMSETRDGAELVEYSLMVLRDEGADWRNRDAARDWLSQYGPGTPPKEFNGSLAIGVSPADQALIEALKLSPEERRKRIAEIDDGSDS